MKNGVTMFSEDVVGSSDAKALTKEGKFCLQVLTQLHAFMRSWASKLKAVDTLHSAVLFVWKSCYVCWVVRADPGSSCGLLLSNTQSCLRFWQELSHLDGSNFLGGPLNFGRA